MIQLGEGCVYPILHAMQKKGLLACRRQEADGRSRLYYRLTPKGRGRLGETVSKWQRLSSAINELLGSTDAKIARH